MKKTIKSIRKSKYFKYFVVISLLLAIFLYYFIAIYPVSVDFIISEANAQQTDAINSGAARLMYAYLYNDLFIYEKNAEGDITLIRSNAFVINQLLLLTQKEIQKEVAALRERNIDVPLGVFFGNPLFIGYGPNINLNVISIGSTRCTFNSSFISQGINQTLHRLYIEVTTSMDVITPLKRVNVTTSIELIVAENLIVGKVPDAYLIGEKTGNFLDLLP